VNTTPDSPYITSANRLADVIAAIQAMAVYEFHMRSFDKWAGSIVGDDTKGEYWRAIFEEHPEFFRLDTTRKLASLVWRRQYPKRYHVDQQRLLSEVEVEQLPESEKVRLSRPPLTPTDVKTLIDTAISLHSRAVELKRESRWWIPLASGIGALVGTIVGGLIKG